MLKRLTFLLLTLAACAQTPSAQELKIGLAAEPSSVDPHYHLLTPNEQLRKHIFEALTGFVEDGLVTPILALSWKTLDPQTWEFKLRNNVRFHDGTVFTAQDVIYSYCRVAKVPNSPSPFTISTKHIVGLEAPDAHTLIL